MQYNKTSNIVKDSDKTRISAAANRPAQRRGSAYAK